MRHLVQFLVVGLFLFVLLSSCGRREQDVLHGIPTEELVRNILLTNVSAPQDEEDTTRYLNLYAELYARLGVDSLQVDRLLDYWSNHPNELNAIMDKVIANLQREYDSLDVPVQKLQSVDLLEDTLQ